MQTFFERIKKMMLATYLTMMNKILYIILMAGLGFAFTGCGSSRDGKQETEAEFVFADSVPETVKDLTAAVRDSDATRFASLVSYPLTRPYPLKDIADEEQMKAYYPTLIDDSLRRMMTQLKDTSWSDMGWKGWTLGDGKYLWTDEQLYAVPYISKQERDRLVELERRELESLPKRFRKGWKPVGCMRSQTSNAIYRIDYNPKAHPGQDYRMMVWNDSTELDRDPAAVFVGRCNEEGTADVRTYFFASKSGAKAVYMSDVTSVDELPRILFTDGDGVNHADTVSAAYWLDLHHTLPSAR